jgi:phage virion morphogenesis protein
MVKIEVGIDNILLNTFLTVIDPNTVTEALLDEAGSFLLNRIRTRYLRETDPTGTPWVPSKAAIERRKRGGTGTLFDTGKLFHSIQLAKLDNERIIGTDVEYGPVHQYGDPEQGIVQRMFLGFADPDDTDILAELLNRRLGQLVLSGLANA